MFLDESNHTCGEMRNHLVYRQRCAACFQGCPDLLDLPAVLCSQRLSKYLFVGKELIERPDAGARPVGDLAHRCRLVTYFRNDRSRSVEQRCYSQFSAPLLWNARLRSLKM